MCNNSTAILRENQKAPSHVTMPTDEIIRQTCMRRSDALKNPQIIVWHLRYGRMSALFYKSWSSYVQRYFCDSSIALLRLSKKQKDIPDWDFQMVFHVEPQVVPEHATQGLPLAPHFQSATKFPAPLLCIHSNYVERCRIQWQLIVLWRPSPTTSIWYPTYEWAGQKRIPRSLIVSYVRKWNCHSLLGL